MILGLGLFLTTMPIPIEDSGPVITYKFLGEQKVVNPVETASAPVFGDSTVLCKATNLDHFDALLKGKIFISLDWKNVPVTERTRCFIFRIGLQSRKWGLYNDYVNLKTFADNEFKKPKPHEERLWDHEIITKDTSRIQSFALPIEIKYGGTPQHHNEQSPAGSEAAVAYEILPVAAGSGREKNILEGDLDVFDASSGSLLKQKHVVTNVNAPAKEWPELPGKGYRIPKESEEELSWPLFSLKKRPFAEIMPQTLRQKHLRFFDDESLEILASKAFGPDWRDKHSVYSNASVTVHRYSSRYWDYPLVQIGPSATVWPGQPAISPNNYILAAGIEAKGYAKAGEPLPYIEGEFPSPPKLPQRTGSGVPRTIQFYGGHLVRHHSGIVQVRSESGQLLMEKLIKWRGNLYDKYSRGNDINFGRESFCLTVMGPNYDGGPRPL